MTHAAVFLVTSLLCCAALAGCEAEAPAPSVLPDLGPIVAPIVAPARTEETDDPDTESTDASTDVSIGSLVNLELALPRAAFKGTPKYAPSGSRLEPARSGPRRLLQVPAGCTLLSYKKPVSASDDFPVIGELEFVTDGDKQGQEGSFLELGPKPQWVQIDLESLHVLHAIVVWQFHLNARIYHDVIVQISEDPDFSTPTTVFNNDHDNSSGLGVGEDLEYWETYEGKLIPLDAATARYVRVSSNSSTEDDRNHFTEVEVWGI